MFLLMRINNNLQVIWRGKSSLYEKEFKEDFYERRYDGVINKSKNVSEYYEERVVF